MFAPKASTPDSKLKSLSSYKKINEKLYYKKVDLSSASKEINTEIPEINSVGISVFLIDNKNVKEKREFLLSGLDPYQARRDIKSALEKNAVKELKSATSDSKTTSKK